ncbi:hypothetical protein JM18_002642 [Phytophthora kernoviae]|uniref:SAM domain-containing protein n=1 Tax=Phytophthora kernoviae TaxID=325452 RepID=A0A921VDX0_9STRA|nr:hypothetical protein JM18_002642 [Phytophthora kernoviae]
MVIQSIVDQLRSVTLEIIEAIEEWHGQQQTKAQATTFRWRGVNYLLKITADLDFLASARGDPLLEVLQVLRLAQNPFLIPIHLDHPVFRESDPSTVLQRLGNWIGDVTALRSQEDATHEDISLSRELIAKVEHELGALRDELAALKERLEGVVLSEKRRPLQNRIGNLINEIKFRSGDLYQRKNELRRKEATYRGTKDRRGSVSNGGVTQPLSHSMIATDPKLSRPTYHEQPASKKAVYSPLFEKALQEDEQIRNKLVHQVNASLAHLRVELKHDVGLSSTSRQSQKPAEDLSEELQSQQQHQLRGDDIKWWGVCDVQDFLDSLGLDNGTYGATFRAQGIDGMLLAQANDRDLEELGITIRLHRVRILDDSLATMVKKRTLTPLPAFDQAALPAFLESHGFKELHALTIWRYLAQNPSATFADIPDIPKTLRALLAEQFAHFTTTVTTEQRSADGTVKLLLRLQDNHEIEAVIMRHKGRNTLCVSSQVGCQMGCTFCATGTLGIIADLCSGEILEQLAHANKIAPIRNVVFMGMGEPLNNYDAVLAAIRAMTKVFGLAPKHITLSTVGVIHRIRQLTRDAPLVRLALSLHAPTQEMRSEIVPTSTAYPLDKLMAAIDDHLSLKGGRLVMVEYCMLAGVNDSIETAHILGKLLQNRSVHVNLIPYNTTDVGAQFQSPSSEAIRAFHAVLREPYNLKATIRENHGTDIDGACGQLALKNKPNGNAAQRDIEDLVASWLSRANAFIDEHQQAIGLTLLGASAVVLAIGFARRGRAHVN